MAAQPRDEAAAKTGRIPPFSEDAERGVLGCALLDPARVLDYCVERQVTSDTFYTPWHRALYEFLLSMHSEGRAIDLVTVGERLRTLGQLDQVGGEAYLEKLIDSSPTSAHIDYYIDLVRQKFMLRSIINRSREAIDACYDGEDNADAILDKAEQSLYDIAEFQTNTVVPWSQAVRDAVVNIDLAISMGKDITGVPTGFLDLDKITHGLQPGDMIIIAARPSMGKTSLAMNIAENAALGGPPDHKPHAVAIFSLEMSRESLVKRMLCSRAKISAHKLSGGYHVSAEYHSRLVQSADVLSKANIYVDDSAGITPIDVRARARRLKRKFGIDLIIVDYLQMMNFPQFAREGRQRETAAMSAAMKAMAKELKVPVIVLSQLSRAPETRDKAAVPKLSDLRDSGSIEQDADVVCLLRRPCKYKDDPEFEDKTLAILDIAKQRNGPTGEIKLNFIDEYTRFENRMQGVDRESEIAPSEGGLG